MIYMVKFIDNGTVRRFSKPYMSLIYPAFLIIMYFVDQFSSSSIAKGGWMLFHYLHYCLEWSSWNFYTSANNAAFCNCSHRFLFAIAPSRSGFRRGLTFAHIYILNETIILTFETSKYGYISWLGGKVPAIYTADVKF